MQLSWWWPGNPQNSKIVLGNTLNDSFTESVDDLGVKYFHDHGTNHGCFGMMEVGVKKLFLLVLRWLAGNGNFMYGVWGVRYILPIMVQEKQYLYKFWFNECFYGQTNSVRVI